MESSFHYSANIVRVLDGDTVELTLTKEDIIDIGFRVKQTVTSTYTGIFRLFGINTAELNSKVLEERELAKLAKVRLTELLNLGELHVITEKPNADGFSKDKYGRYLCKLFVTKPDGVIIDVNNTLIAEGLAEEYMK